MVDPNHRTWRLSMAWRRGHALLGRQVVTRQLVRLSNALRDIRGGYALLLYGLSIGSLTLILSTRRATLCEWDLRHAEHARALFPALGVAGSSTAIRYC